MTKPSWDDTFMSVALVMAARGSCDRLKVGAVIALDRRLIAEGYNGSPSGWESCDTHGHQLVDIDGRKSCARTIHAEENAILQCARNGVSPMGATLYCTASVCYDCLKRISQVGIRRVVYLRPYRSARSSVIDVQAAANAAGIELVRMEVPSAPTPQFHRASGDTLCPDCRDCYRNHPYSHHLDWSDAPWLNQLCDGTLVKL